MEGLIPMVYRALKRHKVRRQYRCLSVGAAQTYHIADFYEFDNEHHNSINDYDNDQNGKFYSHRMETRGRPEGSTNGHRRFASAGEYGSTGGYNFYYDHDNDVVSGGASSSRNYSSSNNKQVIKRYRSHRMFSCFTGTI